MSTETGAAQRRRRGALLEASLLAAAWEELAEDGYPRVDHEGRSRHGRTPASRCSTGACQLVSAHTLADIAGRGVPAAAARPGASHGKRVVTEPDRRPVPTEVRLAFGAERSAR